MIKKATWYRANEWATEVTPVETVAHTEKFVTIMQGTWRGVDEPRRVARVSEGYSYFPEWQQARDHLVNVYSRNLASHEERAKKERERIAATMLLTPPEPAP